MLTLGWVTKAPNLALIPIHTLIDHEDSFKWRNIDGSLTDFGVKHVWESLRPRRDKVLWHRVVWFSHGIPRHAFHVWLLMRKCLKTQDKLRPWDVGPDVDLSTLTCPLCKSQQDSHEHIFFECCYSSQVWRYVRGLAGMESVPQRLNDIIAWLTPRATKRNVKSIIGILVFAAAAYYLWNERNTRLFKNTKRSPEDIRELIMVTVRLKLVTFRFKNTPTVHRMLALWKLPTGFRTYGNITSS